MTAALVIVGQGGAIAIDASFRIGIEDGHEAAGFGKWQRTEQDRVDHGKNRQISTKTNGERQKRSSCKSGRFPEQSAGVTQLPAKLIKQVNAKCFAAIPFNIDEAAELCPCEAGRFSR